MCNIRNITSIPSVFQLFEYVWRCFKDIRLQFRTTYCCKVAPSTLLVNTTYYFPSVLNTKYHCIFDSYRFELCWPNMKIQCTNTSTNWTQHLHTWPNGNTRTLHSSTTYTKQYNTLIDLPTSLLSIPRSMDGRNELMYKWGWTSSFFTTTIKLLAAASFTALLVCFRISFKW